MQISTPARRYAAALLNEAGSAKALPAVQGQIAALQAALGDEAKAALAVPLPRAQRQNLADGLAKALKAHPLLQGMLGLLARNNRLALLPQVLAAFTALYNENNGIVSAQVQSAAPLTAGQAKALTAQLKSVTQAKDVSLTTITRPSLIGGFRVFYNGKVWDESVHGHLENLKQRLRTTLSAHQKADF